MSEAIIYFSERGLTTNVRYFHRGGTEVGRT